MECVKRCFTRCFKCSKKDDVRAPTICARWSMAFGLLGAFCVLFGSFALKASYDSVAASYGLHWDAAIIMIVGGSMLGFGGLLFAILGCCLACRGTDPDPKKLDEEYDDDDDNNDDPMRDTKVTMEMTNDSYI